MSRYGDIKKKMLEKLTDGLPKNLYYHGIHHVLDVLDAAERIGKQENILTTEMELLKVAVLFHDSGFMTDSKNHEEVGCELARKMLPGFGFSGIEIASICGMIMATHYPQKPNNLLEQIICDADLDYLGRDDFFKIGDTLYQELQSQGQISNEMEWNKLQEHFLSSHHYFTKTSNAIRNARKLQHLDQIREKINAG